jgi:hypothetical protein
VQIHAISAHLCCSVVSCPPLAGHFLRASFCQPEGKCRDSCHDHICAPGHDTPLNHRAGSRWRRKDKGLQKQQIPPRSYPHRAVAPPPAPVMLTSETAGQATALGDGRVPPLCGRNGRSPNHSQAACEPITPPVFALAGSIPLVVLLPVCRGEKIEGSIQESGDRSGKRRPISTRNAQTK